MGLPFLAAQLIQMIREDEAEAEEIDAELDARDAAAVAAPAGTGGTAPDAAGPAGLPGTERPWWETDRRFADRFRAVDEPD